MHSNRAIYSLYPFIIFYFSSIKFTFRRSKISNNGTDVAAGQIPELLYMLPPADNALMQSQDTELLNRCIKAQPITDEFHTKVTQVFQTKFINTSCVSVKIFANVSISTLYPNQDSLQPLLSLLKWAWERIMSQTNECTKSSKSEYSADAGKEHEFLSKISKLCFLNVSCLRLLRTNITRICSLPGYYQLSYYYLTILGCTTPFIYSLNSH